MTRKKITESEVKEALKNAITEEEAIAQGIDVEQVKEEAELVKVISDVIEQSEVKEKSKERLAFEALIEKYKTENPVKYELKKQALEAQLNNL